MQTPAFTAFSTGLDPIINNAGQLLFRSNLDGGTAANGVFLSDGITAQSIARAGDSIDGNGTLATAFTSSLSLNDSGDVAFFATFNGTSGGTSDNSGVLLSSAGGLNFVARENDLVPGSAAGDNSTFTSFESSTVSINNSSQVLFEAGLGNTPGGAADNRGIYFGDANGVTEFVRTGDSLLSGAGVFGAFDDITDLTNSGQFVFTAALDQTLNGSADDFGLFRGDINTGAIVTVFQQGDPAGLNGTFNQFVDGDISINEQGQVLFGTFGITGTVNGISDDSGIYLFDDNLGLVEVAREGDNFLGSAFSSTNGGLGFILDDFNLDNNGRITFEFLLDDGTVGIVFANVAKVPEPSSALCLSVLGLFLLKRRRLAH